MRSRPPPLIHELLSLFMPLLLALSLAACSRSTSVTCSGGIVCPAERACSGDGTECIETACGDGIRQESESCDDGNTRDGDGCNHSCESDETCGNGELDPGELCDDGNQLNGDKCSSDCLSLGQCGNGSVDLGEECDDKNESDEDDCFWNCRLARCGDGTVNRLGQHLEECDSAGETAACNLDCTVSQCGDGVVNSKAGEQCDPPGSRSPEGALCNQNCRIAFCGNGTRDEGTDEHCDDGNNSNQDSCLNTCQDNVCGDGYRNPALELCDDGNTDTEACPYGLKSCTVCNANCKLQPGQVSYCGDGNRDEGEDCDYVKACGTCNAQCQYVPAARAVGHIVVKGVYNIQPGDTLAISDGSHLLVKFEFHLNCFNGSHRCIVIPKPPATTAGMAAVIANAIRNAINDGLLEVTVEVFGDTVAVRHEEEGSAGNQLIITDCASNAISVSGMSGGSGFDCAEGDMCHDDEDCVRPLHCRGSQDGPFMTCQ